MSRLSYNKNDAMELNMTRQSGFTLLEISIVMVIMAAMAAIATRSVFIKLDTRMTEHTAVEVWTIGEYAQNYIQKNGEWPDATNSCNDALTAIETSLGVPNGSIPATSPWDTNYITSCNTDSFSISVQTDDDWAPALVNMLAVTRMVGGTTDTTITTLPLPGSIAAFDGLLKRVDTGDVNDNTMETDLYMNNGTVRNSIRGADMVEASEFVDVDNVNFVLDPSETSAINRLTTNTLTTRDQLLALSGKDPNDNNPLMASIFAGRNDDGDRIMTSEPGSADGSISVNDIMLRSVGHWLSSRLPDMVEKRSFVAYGGDLIPKPDCPAVQNSTFPDPEQKIKVHPANGNYAIDYDADYWEVVSNNSSELLHADIYCYYPPLNDTLNPVVSLGQDLNDLYSSGDLVVNDLTGAYTALIGYQMMDASGLGNMPNHTRGTWLIPIYATYTDCFIDPFNGGCTGSGYYYSGRAGTIASVNNTSDKWLSINVNMMVQSSGGDDNLVRINVNGVEDYRRRWVADGRTIPIIHTVYVSPGQSSEITVQGYWSGGSGQENARITSFDVDTAIHASDPRP